MFDLDEKAIICVSENVQRLKSIERFLSDNFGSAYVVEIAESSMEVMDIIATLSDIGIHTSVIITDYSITDMTGLDLIQMIYLRDRRIQVILMTEAADNDFIQKLVSSNYVYAMTRTPVNWNHFLQLVGNACQQYETDTELSKIIHQLRISEEEKNLILENISESILYIDMNKKILWKNSVADKELTSVIIENDGHSRLTGSICGQRVYDRVFKSRMPFTSQISLNDGQMLARYFPVCDNDAIPIGMIITMMDITERVKVGNMNESLLEMSRYINHGESIILIYNKAFQLIDKYFDVKLMCMTGDDFDTNYIEFNGEGDKHFTQEQIEVLITSAKHMLSKNKQEELIVRNNDIDTLLVYPMMEKILIFVIGGAIGEGDDGIKYLNIIAEHIKMGIIKMDSYRKVVYYANHDHLTGLFSRSYFIKRLNNHLRNNRKRGTYGFYSLAVLDLNYFKDVNDNLSHLEGDKVLLEIAQRLLHASRGGDVVARIGGDEFAILFQTGNRLEILGLIQRMQAEISKPVQLAEMSLTMSASFGIVHDIDAYETVEQLIADAVQAMYEAKKEKSSTGKYVFFQKNIHSKMERYKQIKDLLQKADFGKELTLEYQPIIRLSDMEIVGYEGFVRWTAVDGQKITPGEFIQIAEDSGEIIEIGNRVAQMAIEDLMLMKDRHLEDKYISINMTMGQLADDDHVSDIKKIILDHNMNGRSLHIDMNDRYKESQFKNIVKNVNDLRDIGVKVDLDDFGSKHASLSTISRFNMDELKIDKETVGNFRSDQEAATMVKSIISIADSLGLTVTAEGVEKKEELDALRELGCDYAQGYYFMKPGDFEQALAYKSKV